MQSQPTSIGQCEQGHHVYVTHDLNGEIEGATIGANVLQPLPDGETQEPIVVACESCMKLVNDRIRKQI